MKNLADMTPVEIDTILAKIWEKQQDTELRIMRLRKAEQNLQETVRKIKGGARLVQYRTAADGIALMEKLDQIAMGIDLAQVELGGLQEEAYPYEDEYARRPWNRVFLATSHNGHAHNGTECTTCHHGEERTQFVWLVEYSGKPEAEIVADAGERACTVCYPTAPVNVLKRPTKMFTPQEREAQKAREERESERARKAAEAKAKGITAPDGTPLKDRWGDVIKSERTAQIEAVEAIGTALTMFDTLVLEPLFEAHPGLREADVFNLTSIKEQAEADERAVRLVAALAHKQGRSYSEVWEELKAKAEAKAKRRKKDLPEIYRLVSGLEAFREYVRTAEAQGLEPWNPRKK
jgi:hypothetical protein